MVPAYVPLFNETFGWDGGVGVSSSRASSLNLQQAFRSSSISRHPIHSGNRFECARFNAQGMTVLTFRRCSDLTLTICQVANSSTASTRYKLDLGDYSAHFVSMDGLET